MRFVTEKIASMVELQLDGDQGRLGELFESREIYDSLRAEQDPSDWFQLAPNTWDGLYFVERADGNFELYTQERGVRGWSRIYSSLKAAAVAAFANREFW